MRTRTAALVATVLTLFAAILTLGLAASASAESPGLDQYVETIPGGGGPNAANGNGNGNDNGNGGGGGGGDSSPGPAVDSSDLDALRSQGEEGQRAAAVIEATSRVRDNGNGSGGGSGSSSTGTGGSDQGGKQLDGSDADGKAPVEAILSSMFGGGSGGIVLPLIMLAVLVAGLVIAARARKGPLG